jgi:hypothetical protein
MAQPTHTLACVGRQMASITCPQPR